MELKFVENVSKDETRNILRLRGGMETVIENTKASNSKVKSSSSTKRNSLGDDVDNYIEIGCNSQTFFEPFYFEKYMEANHAHKGKSLGVVTSGACFKSMNAAIRGVTRMGLHLGAKIFFIKEGFQGIIDDNITEAKWEDVEGIIHKGGSIIGSARCPAFQTLEGQKRAALNLIKKKIMNLVVIGGDGSLTGAYEFRKHWTIIVDSLAADGEITKEKASEYSIINVTGIIGCKDSDFCGTKVTLGTDSTLHVISEVFDALSSFQLRKKKVIVFEVTGENYGYVALMAGLMIDAFTIFIPEKVYDENWPEDLCREFKKNERKGINCVVVSFGSLDIHGNIISGRDVKQVLLDNLEIDVELAILGHYQAAGQPSFFDRIMALRVGVDAAQAVLSMTKKSVPVVCSFKYHRLVRIALKECIEQNSDIFTALNEKRYDDVLEIRGSCFQHTLEMCDCLLNYAHQETPELKESPVVGVLNVGNQCCGMNVVLWSFVKACSKKGISVLGIKDGFDGLRKGHVIEMSFSSVSGYINKGGCILGSKKTLPETFLPEIVQQLKKKSIKGLLIIGDFQAYKALLELVNNRTTHPQLCIPMAIIPATIENNIPGSDVAIGSDTALNALVKHLDKLAFLSRGWKNRISFAEISGGYSGYLTTMAGLASEAINAYIFEEDCSTRVLLKDAANLRTKIISNIPGGLVLRNENADKFLNFETMTSILNEEGKDSYSVYNEILGPSHMGEVPSPFDRLLGVNLGLQAASWIVKLVDCCPISTSDSAVVIGIRKGSQVIRSAQSFVQLTDFEHEIPKEQWWLKLRPIIRDLNYYI